MRKLLAWLGIATLCVLTSRAQAANDVLKPYVVLILDTSGSMLIQTGAGPTSCGKPDNRINHAVCAINNIVNSYGDMVFSLSRFRESTAPNPSGMVVSCDANGNQEGNQGSTFPPSLPSGGDTCNTQGAFCGDCDSSTGLTRSCTVNGQCNSGTCQNITAETVGQCTNNTDDDLDSRINDGCAAVGTAESGGACNNNLDDDSDGRINDGCAAHGQCAPSVRACTTSDLNFEVLTPLVDGNNTSAAEYTDGSCNTCNVNAAGTLDPEIWGVASSTFTPLAATLIGSKRYWQGNRYSDNTLIVQETLPGFDPINRDPNNEVFLPSATCDPSFSCVSNCCTSQCRPYINILLTDGDETCTVFSNTTAAAASLLTTQPRNDGVTINAIIRTGGTVTVTTAVAHPFAVGDAVFVAGVPSASFNSVPGAPWGPPPTPNYFTVLTVPSTTTLTYAQTASNNSSSGGTIRHFSSNNKYRVETKPIGFGIAPGDPDIEAIAHAGGALDLPGVNEGYYAADEADLELAISQILADSVRAESCNELDDDCDTRVDEDFPLKGSACQATNPDGSIAVGICANTGVLECRTDGTALQCSVNPLPGGTDGPLCNGLDDDCDGVVDQTCRCNAASSNPGAKCDQVGVDCLGGGAAACVCTPITRACAITVGGVGSCPGTQQCIGPNVFSVCAGQTPTVEDCDGVDDDCDGICDGFTAGCSDVVSVGGPAADNPGDPNHAPQVRAEKNAQCANATDDDGDGVINDGCPAVGPAESSCADALDNDTDTFVNDGCPGAATADIPENICQSGIKTCAANCGAGNTFGACSGEILPCNCAPGAGQAACIAACTDPCNGVDDDCDNVIDEDFVDADCSNNCGVGRTRCTNGNIGCNSLPTIGDPTCNNIDDDCDTRFDEDWDCPSPVAGDPETICTGAVDDDGDFHVNDGCPANGAAEAGFDCLDAVDDDTDGLVNDGCPALECPCGSGSVCGGYEKCQNGSVVCIGDPIGTEVCNCADDNCNNQIDEGTICPGGSTCTNCQCAFPCAAGEFPCPLGKKCEPTPLVNTPETQCDDSLDNDGDGTVNDGCPYCVNDPCFQITCPPVAGNQQTCIPKPGFPNEPQCVDTCCTGSNCVLPPQVTCNSPLICFGPAGECRPDDCSTFPDYCTADQACIGGICVSNPCQGVTCDTGKYCIGGACVASCSDVECPAGQRCRQGACETDPCGHACPFGQACNDTTGQCIADPCRDRICMIGEWCNPNDGQCEQDPCVANDVTCPNPGEVCRGGTCVDPDTLRPDAAGEAHVTVGGGGGCSTTGGSSSALLVALALLLGRRKRVLAVRGGGVQ